MKEITLAELFGAAESAGMAAALGIERLRLGEDGAFELMLAVDGRHVNAAGAAHGGVLYALCNEAVAAYAAYKGRKGVGMDGAIRYYRPAFPGDALAASVTERKAGRRTGVYAVELKNQQGKLLADAVFTVMFMD